MRSFRRVWGRGKDGGRVNGTGRDRGRPARYQLDNASAVIKGAVFGLRQPDGSPMPGPCVPAKRHAGLDTAFLVLTLFSLDPAKLKFQQ